MTFIFKMLFSFFAIIFIVNNCGALSDETAIGEGHWNPVIQNHLFRSYNDNRTKVPLHLIQKYNEYLEVNRVEDFLRNFVEGVDEERSDIISTRSGEVESYAIKVSQTANCMPELKTIEIVPESKDPTIRYIPRCTRLEKCGGCCSDSRLACEPTEVQIVSLEIVKFQIQSGNNTSQVLGKEVWNAQRHLKCKCQCRIKQSDCTSLQMYNKKECSCVCRNNNEERQCKREDAIKIWNSDTCKCECLRIRECTTGYTFDDRQCSCTEGLSGGQPNIPQSRSFKVPVLKSNRISLFTY